jgi:hypothetical protein
MTATLNDVRLWALQNDEPRDALYELLKVPARLGMHDDDLGLIPADIRFFENRIAPSSYALVCKAADLDAACRRGNGRLRALLQRFHVSPMAVPNSEAIRADWTALIDYIESHEGFIERGASFTTGASRALTTLRARARCRPSELDQAEVNRIAQDASSEKRKSVRKAVHRLNDLIAARAEHPAIAPLLPAAPLHPPVGTGRASRIVWETLPPAFRASIEAVLDRATETPAGQAEEARARIDAGEDPDVVIADFNAAKNGRPIRNRNTARAGYRNALIWVTRAAIERGRSIESLTDIQEILTRELMEAAVDDHVRRARSCASMKDAEKTQTVHNRLTALRTVAAYGLRDRRLVAEIDLLTAARETFVNAPGEDGMVEETKLFLAELIRAPHLACGLVNAPERIAARAETLLEEARVAKNEARELTALRIFAAAVLFAFQMSRPVRSGNLIRARVSAGVDKLHRLVWLKKGAHAEIKFPPSEVKNGAPIVVSILGSDARIAWRWCSELRDRYMELRKISESIYLIPGAASPRLLKADVVLPPGCIAPSTLAEIWDEGCRIIGLAMHPHLCRHAIATLILAIEPGNYAKAASVLGITEATVRKHYGHEEGQRAAAEVRKALLAEYPDMFKLMKRKAA